MDSDDQRFAVRPGVVRHLQKHYRRQYLEVNGP